MRRQFHKRSHREGEEEEGRGVPPPSRRRRLSVQVKAEPGVKLEPASPAAAAAAAASSSSSARSRQRLQRSLPTPPSLPDFDFTAAAASRPVAPVPPPAMLPGRTATNVLWNVLGRSRGLLPPSVLPAQQFHRRLSSLSLAPHKQLLSAHQHTLTDLDLDPTELRYLLSSGADGLVSVFDVADQINERGFRSSPSHPTGRRQHGAAVNCIQWYPFDTGMFVSGGSDGRVLVWDTNGMEVVHSFSLVEKYAPVTAGSAQAVHTARMSPVASTHALIATGAGTSSHVRLCDMNSGAFSHTLVGHTAEVLTVDWSPTHEFTLASGGADGQIRLWDIRRAGAFLSMDQHNHAPTHLNRKYVDQSEARALRDVAAHQGAVHTVRWMTGNATTAAHGARLVSAGTDRAIRVWDGTSGRNQLVHFEGAKAAQRINRFALSGDGSTLFSPQATKLFQYDTHTGALLNQYQGHFERVTCCAVHPITCDVYTGSADRQVLVWSPAPQGVPTPAQLAEEDEEGRAARVVEMESMAREEREMHMRLMQRMEARNNAAAAAAAADTRTVAARGSNALAVPRVAARNPDEDAWSSDDD